MIHINMYCVRSTHAQPRSMYLPLSSRPTTPEDQSTSCSLHWTSTSCIHTLVLTALVLYMAVPGMKSRSVWFVVKANGLACNNFSVYTCNLLEVRKAWAY